MNTTCDRCGESINTAYHIYGIDGNYGSTCIHIVAKEHGIKYNHNDYGDGAFDVEIIKNAVLLASSFDKSRDFTKRYETIKVIGNEAWKIVWYLSRNLPHRIQSNNPAYMKVYEIVKSVLV